MLIYAGTKSDFMIAKCLEEFIKRNVYYIE